MTRDRKSEALAAAFGVTVVATGLYYAAPAAGGLFGLEGNSPEDLWRVVAFDGAKFWAFFAALFAIMNPLIAFPLFISMIEGRTVSYQNRLALVVSATVLIALVAASILGREMLGFFAISIGSFRIAGGIIVLLMGLAMMRSAAASGQSDQGGPGKVDKRESQAICPLAIPLLAGPGGIATIILYSEGAAEASDYAMIAAVIALMVIFTYGTLRLARPIARLIGETGLTVLGRMIGMIVSAIAVDMMVIGLRLSFPGAL